MRNLIFIIGVFISFCSNAQDIHFSQIYHSKSFINPASIGNQSEKYKFSFHSRSQWSSVSTPFRSNYFSINIKNFLKDNNFSFDIINDLSGDSNFKTIGFGSGISRVMLSDKKNSLLLGLRLYIKERSFNSDNLVLLDFESFLNYSTVYADLSCGMLYNRFISSTSSLSLSGSIDHINRPNISFFESQKIKYSFRKTISLSYNYSPNTRLEFIPSFFFSQILSTHEILYGINSIYNFESNDNSITKINTGFFIRDKDAFIIILGADFNQYSCNISYDINTSSLAVASNNYGAFEISFHYKINSRKKTLNKNKQVCPSYI